MPDRPRLSHLYAHVPDLAAMRRFYVDLLGLEVLVDEDGYLRLGGGGGFAIGLEDEHPGAAAAGMEINVQVEDIDGTYRRLVDAGVVFEDPPADMPWGVRACWLRDPSGQRIGLFTPGEAVR